MTTRSEYLLAAEDFAKAAGDYFAAMPAARDATTTSRDTARQASAEEMLARAEVALPKSEAFNVAVDVQLRDATLSDAERRDTDLQLLSKMLTDLHIGQDLLDASDSEMASREADTGSTRSRASNSDALRAIAGITAINTTQTKSSAAREVTAVPDLPTAKSTLAESIEDTFDLISKCSVAISKGIVSSAVDLGFSQIAQSAGDMVKTAANWLGKAENLNRLVEMARKFLAKAYEAALKYIGNDGLDLAKNNVVNWLKELVDNRDTKINEWMEKLYAVQTMQPAVLAKAQNSTSDLTKHVAAINAVGGLNGHFKQYVDVVDKIMKLTPMLKTGILALHQPQAIAGLAVFYVLAFAMVVLTGGAFLDAPQLKVLRNIRGVDDLVTANLA